MLIIPIRLPDWAVVSGSHRPISSLGWPGGTLLLYYKLLFNALYYKVLCILLYYKVLCILLYYKVLFNGLYYKILFNGLYYKVLFNALYIQGTMYFTVLQVGREQVLIESDLDRYC